jgi:hypothetical protein
LISGGGLGSRKGARDYVKEWVRPKPVSELEIIIRREERVLKDMLRGSRTSTHS